MDNFDVDEVEDIEGSYNQKDVDFAKATELARFEDLDVYDTVPSARAVGRTRVSTRWEIGWSNTKKKVKARFVAREFKRLALRHDLFAVSSAHDTGRMIDFVAIQLALRVFTFDLTNAFLHVPEEEEVYVDPRPSS